jgi:hypothetical protein
VKEYRLPLAQLDREEVELLPTREALDININTIVAINLAFAFAGIGDDVKATAGQLAGIA